MGQPLLVPPQTGLAALHWAAAAGDIAVVSELLALGADIEAESEVRTSHSCTMRITCTRAWASMHQGPGALGLGHCGL